MKLKIIALNIALAAAFLFFIVSATYAQVLCLNGQGPLAPGQQYCSSGGSSVSVPNPINATSVQGLINNVIKTILGIVGALALFMFVYGGMLWMTSGGNSGRIEKGKDTLIWATIGLFIIFASYAILNFILTALAG